jgi:hypothetical protein
MRRAALAALALLALAGSTAPAGAWVFYFRDFGEWRVICWRSYATATDPQCTLTGPPEVLSSEPQNTVHVQEYRPDTFQVAIEVRGLIQRDAPVWLKVGAFAAHEAAVERDFGRWVGERGLRVVSEMLAADRLAYRVRYAPDGRPWERELSLAGFAEALAAYRTEIRRHGILGQGR